MKKKIWGFTLIVAMALLVFILVFFRDRKPDLIAEVPTQVVPTAQAGAEAEPQATPSLKGSTTGEVDERVAPMLSEATRETISRCVAGARAFRGITGPKDFMSLDELLKSAIEHSPRDMTRDTRYRNVHVRTQSGEVLRLHFAVPKKADGPGTRLEMRMFGVDHENLPIPRELPKDLESLGKDEAIARFKAQGEVIFDEEAFSQELEGRSGAAVISRFGRVRELEVFLERGGVLACATSENVGSQPAVECRCF